MSPGEIGAGQKDTGVLKSARKFFFLMSFFYVFIHKNVKQKVEITWNLWYNKCI